MYAKFSKLFIKSYNKDYSFLCNLPLFTKYRMKFLIYLLYL